LGFGSGRKGMVCFGMQFIGALKPKEMGKCGRERERERLRMGKKGDRFGLIKAQWGPSERHLKSFPIWQIF